MAIFISEDDSYQIAKYGELVCDYDGIGQNDMILMPKKYEKCFHTNCNELIFHIHDLYGNIFKLNMNNSVKLSIVFPMSSEDEPISEEESFYR
jgi:hypothetical protein